MSSDVPKELQQFPSLVENLAKLDELLRAEGGELSGVEEAYRFRLQLAAAELRGGCEGLATVAVVMMRRPP